MSQNYLDTPIVMKTDADLINAIGGASVVARGLERITTLRVGADRIYMWPTLKDGIPKMWRPAVAQLAEEASVSLPPGFLGDDVPIGAAQSAGVAAQ